MTNPDRLTMPPNLSPGAAQLWTEHLAVLAADDLEPTPGELRLLTDAVNAATLVDTLSAALAESDGFTVPGARGAPRPNPLLLEVDRARRTCAALLKQLAQADRQSSSAENGARRWKAR